MTVAQIGWYETPSNWPLTEVNSARRCQLVSSNKLEVTSMQLTLDRHSRVPLYQQIRYQIREM
ncbi:MAG: hypothetical protein J7M34_07685, partial [Anaerolineae bacterium]|nr:hypothetical protein [Anaerolineae bacterium]